MRIGNYQVSAFVVDEMYMDGGIMFGLVPKVIWGKEQKSDDKNRIPLVTRVLLIENEERKILVDVGIGKKLNEKERIFFGIKDENRTIKEILLEAGKDPQSITDLIITHLHSDHVGGATEFYQEEIVPTFPNATYIVEREQWEWSKNPTELDRRGFLEKDYIPLYRAGLLKIVEGPMTILDGIETIVTEGHSPGMLLVKIKDEKNTILFCADTIPTSFHVRLPWIMSYDLFPLTTLSEKRGILKKAVEEDWILVFCHDPFVEAAKVGFGDKGFFLKERISL